MNKNLLLRSLVALLIGPLILFVFYKGGILLFVFLSCLSIILTLELSSVFPIKISLGQRLITSIMCAVCPALSFFLSLESMIFVIAFTFVLVVLLEIPAPIEKTIERTGFSCISLCYIGIGLGCAMELSIRSVQFSFFSLVVVWISDTMAYFVGMLFGKHKMSSEISPKKTVEGLLGAILGGALTGLTFSIFLSDSFHIEYAILLGTISAIVTQLGDLFESKLKRQLSIKDTSSFIPGHGGFLDRFDSFLIVSPFILLVFSFIPVF